MNTNSSSSGSQSRVCESNASRTPLARRDLCIYCSRWCPFFSGWRSTASTPFVDEPWWDEQQKEKKAKIVMAKINCNNNPYILRQHTGWKGCLRSFRVRRHFYTEKRKEEITCKKSLCLALLEEQRGKKNVFTVTFEFSRSETSPSHPPMSES